MKPARRVAPWILAAASMAWTTACGEPRTATDPARLTSSTPPPADEMELARACTADAECVHLGDFCKGGCAVTVNRKHSDAVRARLSTPERMCVMDCPPVDPPVCRQGRCLSPTR